jgi:aspartokinase/homoserine dehydrogenase 1
MIVHKFGGTSVGDASRFANVVNILVDNPGSKAVIVSAMSGVTDQLISGARAAAEGRDSDYREVKARLMARHLEVVEKLLERADERLEAGGLIEDRLHDLDRLYRSIAVLGEVTQRGYDAVASFGEQLSASLLAAALRERGLRAQSINAASLIVTDSTFGAAHPLLDQTRRKLQERLKPLVDQSAVPVITGYIAANEAGVITTLGRGGSDYSAALIAAGLDADELWIWSDVDGILTADPNIVPEARTLAQLSYEEAAELAYYGAEVLHPKTIRPVVSGGIPLRLLNSFNPSHPGTSIVRAPGAERELLPAIISTTGLAMVVLGSQDDHWTPQLAARALSRLSEAGVEVPMFSQSFSEHNLNLVVRQRDQNHCLKLLCQEFGGDISPACEKVTNLTSPEPLAPGESLRLETRQKVATVSVVGVPQWNETGIVAHAFAALGKAGTRVIAVAQAATEYSASFCIPEDQVGDTVRTLHRELGLDGAVRQ